jgi:hypothetical protein
MALIDVKKAKTLEITAGCGITIERKGVYYKENYSETRSVPEGCNIEKEKDALWNSVHAEVDKQVEEILKR